MAKLVTLKGPDVGREYPLAPLETLIGRQPDCAVWLESPAVSRQHARLQYQNGLWYVEDLGSSNGTFVNNQLLNGRQPLRDTDTLQIGPYAFNLRPSEPPQPAPSPASPVPPSRLTPVDDDLVIRDQVQASPSNATLYGSNPAQKLQVVMEISQLLSRTLEVEPLLAKLLDHLLVLFPQADRGMVFLCERDQPVVRAARGRGGADPTAAPFSRTIVRRALDEGAGLLSEDVRSDQRFAGSATIMGLDFRSLLCVPLVTADGRRLGAVQLDRQRGGGGAFVSADLQLLTTIGLQAAVVLENVALHAERLREERLRQELAMAREIQQGFLPSDFQPLGAKAGFELFARVHPAREVSGDLYDFFARPDGRLAFCLGDVSGKGMPAALFMVAVRTLFRLLATESASPAEVLRRLNDALAADNPSAMFVTLSHGIYDPKTGEALLSSAGHPLPLVRHPYGGVESVTLTNGRLLGYAGGDLRLRDQRVRLEPGDTLVLYSDGFTEARGADGQMFGTERLYEALGGSRTSLPLEACADEVRGALMRYAGSGEQQDDLTLLLLRRIV